MMRKTALFNKFIGWALVCLMLFSSCTPSLVSEKKVKKSVLMSESSRMISEYYEEVRGILVDNSEYTEEEIASYGTLTGEEITRKISEYDNGEDYLNFLYQTSFATDPDDVINAAESFLSEEEMTDLKTKAKEIEDHFEDVGERCSRALSPSEKEQFYEELRSLTVKSIVLLTAAIVYAIIPKVMFWGKVSAATAISIAAGIVASTLITIIEWSDKDIQKDESAVQEWLDNITSEPVAAWALAQSVISTQAAITSTTAVPGALILAVFAIYHITDSTKKILKNYNWKV